MNPNAGEPSNQAGGAAAIDSLEGVVAAAKEAAAVQTVTTPGQEAPTEGPRKAFENQFGLGSPTSSVVEQPAAPPDLMDKALQGLGSEPPAENPSSTDVKLNPDINTVDDLLKEGQRITTTLAPEAAAPAEKTPAERLKQQIADSVDAFLKEVTK